MNLIKKIQSTVDARVRDLRDDETGASAVEYILITLGVIVLAGIVIAAIAAYVNGQVGQLPG